MRDVRGMYVFKVMTGDEELIAIADSIGEAVGAYEPEQDIELIVRIGRIDQVVSAYNAGGVNH